MQNQIASMPGTVFWPVYAAVALLTLLICWWRIRRSDPTASLPPLPVPSHPDPYEVAYLRGGENEAARVAILGLMQRGYLRMNEEKKFLSSKQVIERATEHPDLARLSPLERAVYDSFGGPYTPAAIFQVSLPLAKVREYCASYVPRLHTEQILADPEAQTAALPIKLAGAAVIVVLGGYKLLVALSKGHTNVGFLILIGVVSLLVLSGISTSRLSRRGERYLQDLQMAFGQIKEKPWERGIVGEQLVLAMGLFGLGVLAGTPFDDYRKMLAKGQSNGGASCGGGCGSGGDGGCGGGCGGCGGCG